jgi:hypothetical protein
MASLQRKVLEKYPNKYFVETGTCWGDTVQLALECGFKKIITMEISAEKVKHNEERFCKEISEGRVEIFYGDTVDIFKDVIAAIDSPATFWLDAHWDDGPKGEYLCPLPIELDILINHPIKEHTILIDDKRLFGVPNTTWGHTIDLDGIIDLLYDINSNYTISYEDGCVPKDIIVAKIKNEKSLYPL